MIIENFNSIIIEKITENIPYNLKIVNYLMDILGLGREAAYRRIRGQIPFTLDEVIKLSVDLNFSVDEIIKENHKNINTTNNADSSVEEIIKEMYLYFNQLAMNHVNADNNEIIIAQNRIFILALFKYKELLRFVYYKWMHQRREVSMDYKFSEVVIPETITSVAEEYLKISASLENVSVIIDSQMYMNMIKEIQYYYKRKLITEEEIEILKISLLEHLKKEEEILRTNYSSSGRKYDCYLCDFLVAPLCLYSMYDGIEESDFWIYPPQYIKINDPQISASLKEWLNSLKRYSTLITGANENVLSEFNSKQIDYITNMDKIMY